MSRFVCSVMVAVAVMTVTAAPVGAAPDEDFVVGSGRFAIPVLPSPTFPDGFIRLDGFIDAHSDASGANPSGAFTLRSPDFGLLLFSGPVTCLEVTGNTAVIGFDDQQAGHYAIQVVDNTTTGTADTFAGPVSVAGCSFVSGVPVLSPIGGDFAVVHDALPLTSKDQCKDGGWRDFTDGEGNPFDNQGECIAFVLHTA